jgi:hypothetical protein
MVEEVKKVTFQICQARTVIPGAALALPSINSRQRFVALQSDTLYPTSQQKGQNQISQPQIANCQLSASTSHLPNG